MRNLRTEIYFGIDVDFGVVCISKLNLAAIFGLEAV